MWLWPQKAPGMCGQEPLSYQHIRLDYERIDFSYVWQLPRTKELVIGQWSRLVHALVVLKPPFWQFLTCFWHFFDFLWPFLQSRFSQCFMGNSFQEPSYLWLYFECKLGQNSYFFLIFHEVPWPNIFFHNFPWLWEPWGLKYHLHETAVRSICNHQGLQHEIWWDSHALGLTIKSILIYLSKISGYRQGIKCKGRN